MAMQDPQAEPSMEEILASIRRIISEEEQPASEPVLDLTEHESAVASTDEDDIVFEAVEQAVAAAPAPAPTMTHTPAIETPPAPPEPTLAPVAMIFARRSGARKRIAKSPSRIASVVSNPLP